jgi:hypothetical protein
VLVDTRCHNLPDRPDLRRTDCCKFLACLEDEIPFNPELPDEAHIDTCVGGLSCVIEMALGLSTPKSRPCAVTRPIILARIQHEICLTDRLSQWQITRDSVLTTEVNRLQMSVTHHLFEWSNE